MLLYINTTQLNQAEIALVSRQEVLKTTFKVNRDLSEKLLPKIQFLLKKSRGRFSDVSKVAIVTGRGSYTGVRVGVSMANALSYSLNIPIFQLDSGTIGGKNLPDLYSRKGTIGLIRPVYGGNPNISRPKRSFL